MLFGTQDNGPYTDPITAAINATRGYGSATGKQSYSGFAFPAAPTPKPPSTAPYGGAASAAPLNQIRQVINPYSPNPYNSPPSGTLPAMNPTAQAAAPMGGGNVMPPMGQHDMSKIFR